MLVHHAGHQTFAPRPLTGPVVTIGRIPGNDVVLDSPNVSRRHAKLLVTDFGVTAHDLDSHNGVFVNGKKVRSAPLGPGDLLYVGDVCVRIERDSTLPTAAVGIHADVDDNEDPVARAFAALTRAATLVSDVGSASWSAGVLQVCRELVDGSVAVLIEVRADGDLFPIVSAPESGGRIGPTVVWPLVQKAVATRELQFVTDLRATPIVDDVPEDAPRAVLAVPILGEDNGDVAVAAVLYVARAVAGATFGEPECAVIRSISGIAGLRLLHDREESETMTTAVANNGAGEVMQRIASLEEGLLLAQSEASMAAGRVTELQAELDRQRLDRSEHEAATARRATELTAERTAELTSELAEARRQTDDVRAAASADIAVQQVRVQALQTELDTLRTELERVRAMESALGAERDAAHARALAAHQEAEASRAAIAARDDSAGAAADALRGALRASVLPVLVEHVESRAAGTVPPTSLQTRALTAVHIALSGFDTYCEKAPAETVKETLDRFCAAVAQRAAANGGHVHQIVGHGHLVVFDADDTGCIGAIRCALDLEGEFPGDDGAPGIVAGAHRGNAVMGFFGGIDQAAYVEAGAPVAIARAACEHGALATGVGAPRGVFVSDAVRAPLASVPGLRFTRLGPVWIPGIRAAVSFSVVEREVEGSA